VIAGDVGDFKSLQKAAEEVTKITGGSLDVLINNAGLISEVSAFKTLSDFQGDDFAILEKDLLDCFKVNALGLVHAVQAFLPLIRKGTVKKVVNISSGMADNDVTNGCDLSGSGPYSISKAAANVVIAKYNAAHKSEGILFLSLSPGFVMTEYNVGAAASNPEGVAELGKKLASIAPHFKGPITAEESITAMLKVIGESSVEKGQGGAFISHFGNKQWL